MTKVMVKAGVIRRRSKKLTDQQINKAIELYNLGWTQKALCAKFGVSAPTMRRYIRSRTPSLAEKEKR